MTQPRFILGAITLPDFIPDEATRIVRLLDDGYDIVHIRKPGADTARIRDLIQAIPTQLHPRLRLHDAPELLKEFDLGGFHLNSRQPSIPAGAQNVSRSCHSLAELDSLLPDGSQPEYQTLSPIFDSISKPGYKSAFDLDLIRPHIISKRVLALGGVTPQRIPLLKSSGFIGALLLGAAWSSGQFR